MIELHCIVKFRLAVFSYSCLNIYNSPYANVRFLPVSTTYATSDSHMHLHINIVANPWKTYCLLMWVGLDTKELAKTLYITVATEPISQ